MPGSASPLATTLAVGLVVGRGDLVSDPQPPEQALEIQCAGARLDYAIDLASSSACLNAAMVLMSGLGAPLRANMPKAAHAMSAVRRH